MDHLLETILLTQQSIHYIHQSTIHTCFKRTLSNINSVPNVNQSCLIKDTILSHIIAMLNQIQLHSQYPMLFLVMVVFTLIPIVHFISLTN